jgi:hypothetical protein
MNGIELPGLLEEAAQPTHSQTLVTVHDGVVVLHFQHPCECAAYSPAGAISDGAKLILNAVEADGSMGQLAIDVAIAIIDAIYERRGDLKPMGGAAKSEMINKHRAKLRERLRVMLNSQREKRTVTNAELARRLVDTMLSEVFS